MRKREFEFGGTKGLISGLLVLAVLIFSYIYLTQDYVFLPSVENVVTKDEMLSDLLGQNANAVQNDKIDPNRPMLALTFDDGPSKYTIKIIEALEARDARATFFMLGTNVNRYPDTVKRMKEAGCEIGNHTTDHARLTELPAEGIMAQIESTNAAIANVIGEGASVVRPPYGAVNDVVKAAVTEPLVFWNVDTLDWKNQNVEQIVNGTMSIVKDGDIVLLHDIFQTTADAAVILIERLTDAGYQLVTVSEMAEARGIVLETGKEYAYFKP